MAIGAKPAARCAAVRSRTSLARRPCRPRRSARCVAPTFAPRAALATAWSSVRRLFVGPNAPMTATVSARLRPTFSATLAQVARLAPRGAAARAGHPPPSPRRACPTTRRATTGASPPATLGAIRSARRPFAVCSAPRAASPRSVTPCSVTLRRASCAAPHVAGPLGAFMPPPPPPPPLSLPPPPTPLLPLLPSSRLHTQVASATTRRRASPRRTCSQGTATRAWSAPRSVAAGRTPNRLTKQQLKRLSSPASSTHTRRACRTPPSKCKFCARSRSARRLRSRTQT